VEQVGREQMNFRGGQRQVEADEFQRGQDRVR